MIISCFSTAEWTDISHEHCASYTLVLNLVFCSGLMMCALDSYTGQRVVEFVPIYIRKSIINANHRLSPMTSPYMYVHVHME